MAYTKAQISDLARQLGAKGASVEEINTFVSNAVKDVQDGDSTVGTPQGVKSPVMAQDGAPEAIQRGPAPETRLSANTRGTDTPLMQRMRERLSPLIGNTDWQQKQQDAMNESVGAGGRPRTWVERGALPGIASAVGDATMGVDHIPSLAEVKDMGAPAIGSAVAQILAARGGKMARTAAGAGGAAVVSAVNELLKDGPVNWGKVTGDAIGGANNSRGVLSNAATNMLAANAESAVNTGELADAGTNLRAGKGGAVGASIAQRLSAPDVPAMANAERRAAIAGGHDQNLKMIPSAVGKDTLLNDILETISGRGALKGAAKEANDEAAVVAGRKHAGLGPDEAINHDNLNAKRTEVSGPANDAQRLGDDARAALKAHLATKPSVVSDPHANAITAHDADFAATEKSLRIMAGADPLALREAQRDLNDAYRRGASPAERLPLKAKVDELTASLEAAAQEAVSPTRASIDAAPKTPVGSGHGTGTPADKGLPQSRFFVDSDTGGTSFRASLERASASHPAGAAVEVKDAGFYTDTKNRLFLSPDKSAGAAVSADGDLVSVFKAKGATGDIDGILEDASKHANRLDALASGDGYLPKKYAKYGFRTVARVKFDPKFAPPGWNFAKYGEPDVVYMVKDSIDKPYLHGDFKSAPLVSYDEAIRLQAEAVKNATPPKPPAAGPGRPRPELADLMGRLRTMNKQMGKTYDIQDSLNHGDGSVDLGYLGRAYQKNPGKMTGAGQDMGRFANSMQRSGVIGDGRAQMAPGNSGTNMAGVILALSHGGVKTAAALTGVPLARSLARRTLLSKYYQKGLVDMMMESPQTVQAALARLAAGQAARSPRDERP